jgi:hypothetical protein
MMPTGYYLARGRNDEPTTSTLLDGVATVPLVGLLVLALVYRAIHRRHARDAAESERGGSARLKPGPTVIAGQVIDDGEAGPAVSVTIDQFGTERCYKGDWRHTWRETGREIAVRPFYVQRDDGSRVRIEPDARAFLVDKLDGKVLIDRTHRRRTATLATGERVHIVGTLVRAADPMEGGYREAGDGWVLRPMRGGSMLISTEPLADRSLRRARVHRNLAIALFLALLTLHGGIYGAFNLLRLRGHEVEATVVSTSTYKEWRKPKRSSGYWVHYYKVKAFYTDDQGAERWLEDHISLRYYNEAQPGTKVPFIVAKGFPDTYTVGHAPSSDGGGPVLGLFIFLIGFSIAFPAIVIRTRPWYERKKVIDYGRGQL